SGWVDAVVGSSDAVAGNADDIVLARFSQAGPLNPGETLVHSETFHLPPALQGRFHIFVRTDIDRSLFENNRLANNATEAQQVFDVTPVPYADLVVDQVTVPAPGASGRPLEVHWSVSNQGIGPTNTASWFDALHLARDPQGTDIVAFLGLFSHSGFL